jgi:signal transduction histidine kinase
MYEERLRSVPLFADLPQEDLARLCSGVHEIVLEPGASLFEEGEEGNAAYVIIEGKIEITQRSAGGDPVLLAVRSIDEVIGEMALVQSAPRAATARAQTAATLIAVPKSTLDELLITSPSAVRTIFEAMLQRWKDTQSRLRQSERMAQLGTLSAGLAHELNNPAAAIGRAAAQLSGAIDKLTDAVAGSAPLLEAGTLDRLLAEVRTRSIDPPVLDSLTRADLEGEVETWLTRQGISDSWDVSPALVALGFGPTGLTELTEELDATQRAAALRVLRAAQEVSGHTRNIVVGAGRISSIVGALKSYSYLDQAPVQTVDVRRGLDDTLLILERKLEGITVTKEYDDNTPEIEAYGSELNQVWTNLLDNAADALTGTTDPTIVIRVRADGSGVVVEVEDNGPGIPEKIQHRVFDSFFTTKPPGSGTGLGLDISRSIITDRHGGWIGLESAPGRTLFRVKLSSRPPS